MAMPVQLLQYFILVMSHKLLLLYDCSAPTDYCNIPIQICPIISNSNHLIVLKRCTHVPHHPAKQAGSTPWQIWLRRQDGATSVTNSSNFKLYYYISRLKKKKKKGLSFAVSLMALAVRVHVIDLHQSNELVMGSKPFRKMSILENHSWLPSC